MVDNENQWEDDMEYSDVDDDSYDDGAYSDSDDQGYDSYDEDYEDEDYGQPQRRSNPLPILLVFLILLGVVGYFAYTKFAGGGEQSAAETQSTESYVSQQEQTGSTDELANSFFNEAGGDNSDMMSVNFNENGETNVMPSEGSDSAVATVTETSPSESVNSSDLFDESSSESPAQENGQGNDAIMVVYNKASRINPFKPPVVDESQVGNYELVNNTQFEIVEPPVDSIPDENLTRLLQTTISGILFDDESPSAIVNLNGMDQFVKAGDTISGYTIDSITRDKVQVSYKNNSYVASVGELFTRGILEKQQAVVNLENKFAGRYRNNN